MSKILKKSLTVFLLLFTISFSNICCNANFFLLVEQQDLKYKNCCVSIKDTTLNKILVYRQPVPLVEILTFLSDVETKEIDTGSNNVPCLDPYKPIMKNDLYFISEDYRKDIINFLRTIRTIRRINRYDML